MGFSWEIDLRGSRALESGFIPSGRYVIAPLEDRRLRPGRDSTTGSG